ncbi:hypothetical protein RJ55_00814 [Drechmeria coniospora]|nr:hypothetical protein RJ55_00814 [Drechmeria coniospora]
MAPAAPDSEQIWPPRSPHEALLSTPSGRQRYKDMLDRTPPSPSPSRRPRPVLASNPPPLGMPSSQLGADDDDDDDDDEETLQLKLQEIQARLRLKRLQNAKNKENSMISKSGEPVMSALEHQSPRKSRGILSGAEERNRSTPQDQVQIPASPSKKVPAPSLQASPRRVLLGIDKGLKAKDVSLKRAPNYRSATGSRGLKIGGSVENLRLANPASPEPRSLSFNERLTSARTEASFQASRQERIQKVRTNAFGIGKHEMEKYKSSAVDLPDEPLKAPVFTRQEVLSKGKASTPLARSKTATSVASRMNTGESSSRTEVSSQDTAARDVEGGEVAASFEPYSCFHLSRRILPHRVLARHVSGTKTMSLKELLRDVKSPDFSLPDVEQDIVVFAVIAKKSEPRAHKHGEAKNGLKAEERGKYMIMTLCDLDYELDLFLFNSGFTRFWKLTEGTVVAILNPSIMPPPAGKQDTGRFSLVVNSDADTILEIGSARDLGFCQSVRKDGNVCGAWVNKKRTQFCEFHSNEALRKQRGTRLEVNTSGFGGGSQRQKKGGDSKEWTAGKRRGPDNYDWETKTQWFASRSYSAADLIDGKDRALSDKKERREFMKRSLEAKEKEREMMKKLGSVGSAAGREYMQHSAQRESGRAASSASMRAFPSNDTPGEAPKLDVVSLGLTGKGREIHLSPVKRKRPESSQAGSAASSIKPSSIYGWGGKLKDKLSCMKEGETLHSFKGPKSPVRKKTRFVTEKGIREAGRESLGTDLSDRQVQLVDDDEEELVIVK